MTGRATRFGTPAHPSIASIRLARSEDAGVVTALCRDTFVETWVETFAMGYPPSDLDAHMAATFDPAGVAVQLSSTQHRWFVAESRDELLGYALSGPCSLPHRDARAEHGELKRLYVRRAAQGLGLGRVLLERSLAWIEATFEGPVWLGVWSGNLKAQKLYVHHGFRKAGEYDYRVGATRDREYIYCRERSGR